MRSAPAPGRATALMDAVPLGRGSDSPTPDGCPTALRRRRCRLRHPRRRRHHGPRTPHGTGPGRPTAAALTVSNDPDGFAGLEGALRSFGAGPDDVLVCLEATGVYGEALCHWLHGRGYRLAVEDAARVRRAMPVSGAKTDALDARRIAPPTGGGWATPPGSSTS